MPCQIGIKVIVFDFDGTLVQSNQLKYDSYFELFKKDEKHQRVIIEVLSECFELSRYEILEKILVRLGVNGKRHQKVNELALAYNDIVMAGVKACPETKDAERTLKALKLKHKLYLSSITPEDALREIIRHRNWERYFRNVFGYPRKKKETLINIMRIENVLPNEMLVVGDGDSDRFSAEVVGCSFLHVKPGESLFALMGFKK